MRPSPKNLYITIPILFGGLGLCLHGYLGYFSRYIADDFRKSLQIGQIASSIHWQKKRLKI